MNDTWRIRKYKDLAEYMKPVAGIQEMTRDLLKKFPSSVGYRMEVGYNFKHLSKKYVDVCKKGLKSKALVDVIPITSAKRKEIESLLESRFRNNWSDRPELDFYKLGFVILSGHCRR